MVHSDVTTSRNLWKEENIICALQNGSNRTMAELGNATCSNFHSQVNYKKKQEASYITMLFKEISLIELCAFRVEWGTGA